MGTKGKEKKDGQQQQQVHFGVQTSYLSANHQFMTLSDFDRRRDGNRQEHCISD
jgi:hypothetical protein